MWIAFHAAEERRRQEYERDVVLAFTVEWMARQKELSVHSIHKLLRRGNERQSYQEQYAVFHQIAAFHRLKIRRVPRAAA